MYRTLLIILSLLFISSCNRIPVPGEPKYLAGDPATVVRMHLLHTTDNGMLPLVKVDMSGERTWWLLDTGSSHNLITPELAAQHKLKQVGETVVATIGGRKAGAYYQLPVLKVGTLKLDGQSAGTIDLSGLSVRDGYTISGILGVPSLEKLVVALDYQNRTIRFADSPWSQQANVNAVPFQIKGGVPVASLSIGDRRKGDFILDTGNATSLVVLPSYQMPVLSGKMRFIEVEDLGGAIPTHLASIPHLQLGGQRFEAIPVSLPLNNKRYAAVDGSLGNGLLARQPVIFDFQRKRLIFKSKNSVVRSQGSLGFLLARNNVIEVVVSGSPAERAGLKVGDRIMAANSMNTVQASAYAIWKRINGSRVVNLEVLRNGQIISLRIERATYLPLIP